MGFKIKNNKFIKYYEQNGETDFTIPDGVTEIYKKAFENCNLENITIPNSVRYIGPYAFKDCMHLNNIQIPNGVIMIAKDAFNFCLNLHNVSLPDSIQKIDKWAFSACGIKHITLSSYRVFKLLDGHQKLVAAFSIIKNYYNKTVEYTEEEIQDLKEFIRENRIELFPYAMKNMDLYDFMFHKIDKIYNAKDIECLFYKIDNPFIGGATFSEFATFSKVEANSFLLQYIHKNNLHINLNKQEELTLDDLDDNLDNDGKKLIK